MQYVELGRTGLRVSRTSFGVLPLQRVDFELGRKLLRKAYDAGMNFYDTARSYSDSEEKIGYSLTDLRDKIHIATKTMAQNGADLWKDLETSLRNLKTDYVDILQFHNPPQMPRPEVSDGLYQAISEAREKGMVRFIGITSHRLPVAREAAASGLYDTVQFPLSSISAQEDLQIIDDCKKHNIGLLAMKGMSGGLITHAPSTFAFLRQFENVIPLWGIQRERELDEFLALEENPPLLDEAIWKIIERDRKELAGDFCRACGYCLPCPAEIPIPMAARMSLLLRRMPFQQFLEGDWPEHMSKISKCTRCGQCASRCPYGLDTPNLLQKMLDDYEAFVKEHS